MVSTRRPTDERDDTPPALECDGIEEIVQRRAHDLLRRHEPKTLAVVTELVRVGNTAEEVVEHFARQTGREDWQLAHIACASEHARRQLDIISEGGVH